MKKKIFFCITTILMIATLTACSRTSEKETEISEEQDITYPTKKFVEGSIQIETTTYESREGWQSEQETTDIKNILETKELEFSNEAGAIVNVSEEIYSGNSGLSYYDITLTLPDGNVNNLSFEGPSGLHNAGEFTGEWNNYFILYSENQGKRMNIGIPDFRFMFNLTADEYAQLSTDIVEVKESLTDKDFLELFHIQDATYITKTDEYIEFVFENGDYTNIGYSYLKWYYSNPYYIIIDYFENYKTYNDDNAVLILDSIKWE